MNLNIGDKLLCKKNLNINYSSIGKYYNVAFMIDYYNDTVILIKGKWYSLKKNTKRGSYYIWDYFYKTNEVRKLKLKQLKQC